MSDSDPRPFAFLARFAAGGVAALVVANLVAAALGQRWVGAESPSEIERSGLAISILGEFALAEQADLVFAGSSVTRNGVVPEILDEALAEELGRPTSSWNLGMPGGVPELSRYFAEQVFGAGHPKVFVLEASPFLWDSTRPGREGAETYWRWLSDPTDSIAAAASGELPRAFAPDAIKGMNWGMEMLWNPRHPDGWRADMPDGDGITPRGGRYPAKWCEPGAWDSSHDDAQWDIAWERGVERVSELETSAEWRATLDTIAEACNAKGVKLVLLLPPLYAPLVEQMPDGALVEHRRWLQEAAERHGAVWIDLDADPSFDYGRDRFRDALHYNPEAAADFSFRLAPILAPLLRD